MSRAASPLIRRVRRGLSLVGTLLIVGALLAFAWAALRGRPADLPWTALDLGEEPGLFTGRKLAGLHDDRPRCRALLDRAGVRYAQLPVREESEACFSRDGLRLESGGSRRLPLSPDSPRMACPVAAALAMWEWSVVQPAARRHLNTAVTGIEHLGTYNCRRMYGRDAGPWSEHATAGALDVAGFALADGRRLTLLGDWRGTGAEARFLREVRDGACTLYATVLSPDYNDAHRDHFHLDQARRGAAGRRVCR
jgi:hypothetical protein